MIQNRIKMKVFAVPIAMLLVITVFACTRNSANQAASTTSEVDKNFKTKPAKISGILEFHGICKQAYYQVKLKGISEGASIEVESQTDETGRFRLEAPPGQYTVMISHDLCGNQQSIQVEENTEHMFSMSIDELKPSEKNAEKQGRFPASILVSPSP